MYAFYFICFLSFFFFSLVVVTCIEHPSFNLFNAINWKRECVRLQRRETERERERKKEETVFFVNDVTLCKKKKWQSYAVSYLFNNHDQSYIFPCVDQSRSFIIYIHTILVIIVGQRYSKKIVTPACKEDLTFRLRHFDPLDLRLAAWKSKANIVHQQAVDIT